MAHTITGRLAGSGLAHRIARLRREMQEAWGRRQVYNRTVRELSGLSDRELDDLGISRRMITRIAAEAAYGD